MEFSFIPYLRGGGGSRDHFAAVLDLKKTFSGLIYQ
jgi:hypothetical protein